MTFNIKNWDKEIKAKNKKQEEAIKLWLLAKAYYRELLKQRKKNIGKDVRYKVRDKFYIPLSLIEENPDKFIKKVKKWFKNPARYDLEGVDSGKNLDDDVILSYLQKLRKKKRKVKASKDIINGTFAKRYKKKKS